MERYKTLADYQARSSKLRVGGECETWCTRCKQVLTHTILAMTAGEPARVSCNSCKSQHNFRRSAEPGTDAPRRRPPATPTRPAAPSPRQWEEATRGKDLGRPIPYDPKRTFALGEVLIHGRFGIGVVMGIKDGGKMLVTFQDDTRLLVHGR